jgi:phosphatidylinositol-4,5-bisphosphate 3-kinase catalytic subunit alpha/beta/delta
VYPNSDNVIEYAKTLEPSQLQREKTEDERPINEIIQPYMRFERTFDMHEQNRNLIWAKR